MNDKTSRISEMRVMLTVADYDQRREFYINVIGWPLRKEWTKDDGCRAVMFETGQGVVEIFEDPGSSNRVDEFSLSLQVDDVGKLWDRIKDQVNVSFPLRDNAWGDTSFGCTDPGGLNLVFFSVTWWKDESELLCVL